MDDGLPFACSCQSYISRKEALEYVAAGRACWKKFRRHDKSIVDNERELVFFKRPRFPRAKTISDTDIELALDEGEKGAQERERIKRYPEYDFASDRRPVVNLNSFGANAVLKKP
jgi:hypothetical protein